MSDEFKERWRAAGAESWRQVKADFDPGVIIDEVMGMPEPPFSLGDEIEIRYACCGLPLGCGLPHDHHEEATRES